MAQYDVIIVGAGPAGMTAAIYAARADMNVLLLDKLAPGGQIINTNEIQNYPGSERSTEQSLRIRCLSIHSSLTISRSTTAR